jgi:hypothetical protein
MRTLNNHVPRVHVRRCPPRSTIQIAGLWLKWGFKLTMEAVLYVRQRPLVQGNSFQQEVLEFWDQEVGHFWPEDSSLGKMRVQLVAAMKREREFMIWARAEYVQARTQGPAGMGLWYLLRISYLFAAPVALITVWHQGGRDDFIRGHPCAAFVAFELAEQLTSPMAPVAAELTGKPVDFYRVMNPLPWTVLLPPNPTRPNPEQIEP